jgi:hypothetical protein
VKTRGCFIPIGVKLPLEYAIKKFKKGIDLIILIRVFVYAESIHLLG